VITQVLALAGLAFGADADRRLRPAPCDTSTEHLSSLVRYAQELQVDSFWVAQRAQWGWSSRPVPVVIVQNLGLCRRAAAVLIHDRVVEARGGVALVRVGSSYIAQPSSRWDIWIVLDNKFRILSRIVVPS
jgi:hypothetical protein